MANKYWEGSSRAGYWDYDTSVTDTLDNAAAVDKGDGTVGIPITGHAYLASDVVTIAGTTNYNGTYTIVSKTANEIVITDTYNAETFAGTETITAVSNWKLTSDGSDTTKPAAADVIYFDSRAADNSTTGKKQSADQNIDATGTGTPDLAGVYVSSEFDGDIGASGEYLEIEADGDDVVMEGEGTLYLKLSAGPAADADCGRVLVLNVNATAYLASLENDAGNVCLYASVIVAAGTVNLDDSAAVTTLKVIMADATVVGGTGVQRVKATATVVNIIQLDGTITWDSPIGTIDQYGGTFNWGSADNVDVAGLDCDQLNLYGSGRFNWQTADAATSILKLFYAYSGIIDASRTTNSAYAKEIGTGSEISEIWPDATVKLNNETRNISISAGSKIESFGGKLTPPRGAQVDW